MKISMTKNGQTRWCQDHEQQLLESAGWTAISKSATKKAKTEDVKAEVAPAMSKGAVETLDNANQQGDE